MEIRDSEVEDLEKMREDGGELRTKCLLSLRLDPTLIWGGSNGCKWRDSFRAMVDHADV